MIKNSKKIFFLDSIEEVLEFDIRRVGLSLIKQNDNIIVYSDVFRSKPLYIYSNDNNFVIFQIELSL